MLLPSEASRVLYKAGQSTSGNRGSLLSPRVARWIPLPFALTSQHSTYTSMPPGASDMNPSIESSCSTPTSESSVVSPTSLAPSRPSLVCLGTWLSPLAMARGTNCQAELLALLLPSVVSFSAITTPSSTSMSLHLKALLCIQAPRRRERTLSRGQGHRTRCMGRAALLQMLDDLV